MLGFRDFCVMQNMSDFYAMLPIRYFKYYENRVEMFEFPARDRRNRFLNTCHENGKSEYEMEHLISCADHFSK